MKCMLDNTGVHQIGKLLGVLKSEEEEIDPAARALCLLHFVEHLLFADSLVAMTYEGSGTRETTEQVVDFLRSRGCTASNGCGDLVVLETLSEEEYADGCRNAVSLVLEELDAPRRGLLWDLGRVCNRLTRPDKVEAPDVDKYLIEPDADPPRGNWLDLWNRSTDAFAFMIHSSLYLRRALVSVRGSQAHFDQTQSAALSVVFRTGINQELANGRGLLYSPAPQRARAVERWNTSFRQRLQKQVLRTLKDREALAASKFLRRLSESEEVPLPLFALHFLRKVQASDPVGVLEKVMELRNTREVKDLRHWLRKWEEKSQSLDEQARASVDTELRKFSKTLEQDLFGGGRSLFSVVSVQVTADCEGRVSLGIDLGGILKKMRDLFLKLDRRRVFVAAAARGLVTDANLGKQIIRIVGHGF